MLELAERDPLLAELAEREPPRPDPLRDAVVPRADPEVPDLAPPVPDLELPVPGFDPPVPDLELPAPGFGLAAVLRDAPDDGRRRFPLAETVVGSITSGGSSL